MSGVRYRGHVSSILRCRVSGGLFWVSWTVGGRYLAVKSWIGGPCRQNGCEAGGWLRRRFVWLANPVLDCCASLAIADDGCRVGVLGYAGGLGGAGSVLGAA